MGLFNASVFPCIHAEALVHMERLSYSIYTNLDKPNNLTRQSTATNDAFRDPLFGSVT